MSRLRATIIKEITLLWRDRAGMVILFVMPAVLVLVITLVQENVLKVMGEANTRVLFVDMDGSRLGKAIAEQLQELGTVELVREVNGNKINQPAAFELIRQGNFRFGIVIPKGIGDALKKRAKQVVARSLDDKAPSREDDAKLPEVMVYFDPAVRGGFRSAVLSTLNRVILRVEIDEKMAFFAELLPAHLEKNIEESMGFSYPGGVAMDFPPINIEWSKQPLLGVKEEFAFRSTYAKIPTSVQQNVPAWALFGMFFVVVPMAGALIRERETGTLARLLTMPVSGMCLLFGKVAAYVGVCLVQFTIIVLIGKYLLPFLGTPSLDMGSDPVAISVIVLSSILAATGYGIMLGSISRTYEQAAMFGAISVVIAAALGGIMVPVYAMPQLMQKISIVSPLGWGLDAFHDVFVRGGTVSDVLPESSALLVFFAATMLIAWIYLFRRIRTGS